MIFVLGVIETAEGAPQAVRGLKDAGVTQPHTLGPILAAVITVIAVLVALGPERVKRWWALAHGQEPAQVQQPQGVLHDHNADSQREPEPYAPRAKRATWSPPPEPPPRSGAALTTAMRQAEQRSSEPPLSDADRARIGRETEQRIARSIHDPLLRSLDKTNKAEGAAIQGQQTSAAIKQLAQAANHGRQKLAEDLATEYHAGKVLRNQINLDRVRLFSEAISGTSEKRQIEREQLARKWDRGVLSRLPPDLRDSWKQVATPLDDDSTLALIEPTTDIAGVIDFLTAKLAHLKTIVKQLGDSQ